MLISLYLAWFHTSHHSHCTPLGYLFPAPHFYDFPFLRFRNYASYFPFQQANWLSKPWDSRKHEDPGHEGAVVATTTSQARSRVHWSPVGYRLQACRLVPREYCMPQHVLLRSTGYTVGSSTASLIMLPPQNRNHLTSCGMSPIAFFSVATKQERWCDYICLLDAHGDPKKNQTPSHTYTPAPPYPTIPSTKTRLTLSNGFIVL